MPKTGKFGLYYWFILFFLCLCYLVTGRIMQSGCLSHCPEKISLSKFFWMCGLGFLSAVQWWHIPELETLNLFLKWDHHSI